MTWELTAAIFIASLLGSSHCAGMCGAFALFATETAESGSTPIARWKLHALYNIGRLLTYLALGLAAGAAGAAIDLGSSGVGIQRAAAAIAALIMIGFGGVSLLRALGVQIARFPVPQTLLALSRAGHARALGFSPRARAISVGLLTTLLPCGWLYAFVVASAATGSPVAGAGTMAVFWLGTLPVMATLAVGARFLAGPLRAHLPLLTNVLVVATALWMHAARVNHPIVVRPRSGSSATQLVSDLRAAKPAEHWPSLPRRSASTR